MVSNSRATNPAETHASAGIGMMTEKTSCVTMKVEMVNGAIPAIMYRVESVLKSSRSSTGRWIR